MDDTERARSLADRYWEDLLELEPMLGTMIGDERYDDRLSDPSEAGRRATAVGEPARRSTSWPRSIGPRSRSRCAARSTSWRRSHDGRSPSSPTAPTGSAPPPISSDRRRRLAEVAAMQAADTPERLDRYEARLRAFPAYMDAWADIAREGVAAGVTSPRLVTERAVAQVERLLALAPEDVPGDRAGGRRRRGEAQRIADVVRDVVNPAFASLPGDAGRVPPAHCTETIGLSALPDGDEIYAALILAWTTLPLDPREVHELGLERYAGIQEERAAIAGPAGIRERRRRRSRRIRPAARTPRRVARRAAGAGARAGRAELGRVTRVLRSHAARQLRRPPGRGVPGAGHAARLLQPADRGRIAPRRLLHQHVRPPRSSAPSHREPHVPRGEPRPSLPALDRAGDPRPARAATVRRHPREQRVRGRVGPLQRTPGRRDGPVPRRLGTPRACWRRRACAPPAWSPTPGSTRWGGRASRRSTRWKRSARRTSTR